MVLVVDLPFHDLPKVLLNRLEPKGIFAEEISIILAPKKGINFTSQSVLYSTGSTLSSGTNLNVWM